MATEEQCRQAMKLHEDRLLGLANVEGLGVREIEVPDGDDFKSQLCVAVYVRKKVPRDQLAPEDIIPKTVPLSEDDDRTIVDVPTAVFEIGELRLDLE